MQTITPFLWFDNDAEEAVKLYTSVFKDSEVLGISRYGEGPPAPAGSVMSMSFRLEDQEFIAFNGGPALSFSSATSFLVDCETQDEIDEYWERLSNGGKQMDCGWLTDRFGVTWQIVPSVLSKLLNGPDPEGAKRAMEAMMKMKKLDIGTLQRAYDGDTK
jgi:predicted 3-demethylubiquinone-9 3-methyltransferase (glyoxalase superfamily)